MMYKVIIVEDDPMVASINRQYLQSNPQLQVMDEFRNGKQALEYLKKHPADLAIIDYYMPVMDGRDFILACHKHQIRLDFIMITAANSVQEIEGILQSGVIDYLIKPFTFERFRNAIQKYISYKEILQSKESLNQEALDRIIALNPTPVTQPLLEKGLQLQTLHMIQDCLAENQDLFLSSNEIAARINLSRITVRRYMNYLLENGEIISQVDYTTEEGLLSNIEKSKISFSSKIHQK